MLRAIPAAILTLLVLLPAASALTLTIEGPPAPLRPEVEMATITGTVSLDCTDALVAQAPDDTLPVHLAADPADPNIILQGITAVNVDVSSCTAAPDSSVTKEFTLGVGVTRDLEGLVPWPVNLTATAEATGPLAPLGDIEPAHATFEVTAAPYILFTAHAETPIQEVRPGESAAFTITIENLGNSPITIRTLLLEASPDEARKWLHEIPDTVVPRGATQDLIATFDTHATDGFQNEQALFRLGLESEAAGETGPAIATNLLIRIHGGGAQDTPAMGTLGGLGCLLAATLLARRRL